MKDDIIKLMEDFNHEHTHRAAVEIANLRLELCLLRAPSTSIGAATEESMRQYAEARGWSWEAFNKSWATATRPVEKRDGILATQEVCAAIKAAIEAKP